MNKTINLLIFLLVINLLIFSNLLISKYHDKDFIFTSYAKTVTDNNDNYNLIVSILKDTNKNNLIKYADYIELNIIKNIPNDKNNLTAFTLSLPEKASFIAIYSKIDNNNYKFEYLTDNLFAINTIYFYEDFLVIEQTDTNNLNNLISREFIEIFKLKDNSFQSIFIKDIINNKLFSEDNINYKESQKSSIDFLSGSICKIVCITTKTIYIENSSSLSSDVKFDEIKNNTIKQIYIWNDLENKFILSNEETIR